MKHCWHKVHDWLDSPSRSWQQERCCYCSLLRYWLERQKSHGPFAPKEVLHSYGLDCTRKAPEVFHVW